MLDAKTKAKIIKKFRQHDSDTGSANVQIAILSEEIKFLTDHLKIHKKDFSSRRGLIKKVNERRKLLNYLRQNDYDIYVDISKKLKLKVAAPKIVEAIEMEEQVDEE